MGNPYAPPGATPPRHDAPMSEQPGSPRQPERPPEPPQPGEGGGPQPGEGGGPQPGEGGGPQGLRGPDLPPPDPEKMRLANRRSLYFGAAMLGVMVTMSLQFPWNLSGIVVGIAALVLGARALAAILRARLRGIVVPALIIGLSLVSMFVLQLTVQAADWQGTVDYQECLDGAITNTAKEGCAAARLESFELPAWLSSRGTSTPGS